MSYLKIPLNVIHVLQKIQKLLREPQLSFLMCVTSEVKPYKETPECHPCVAGNDKMLGCPQLWQTVLHSSYQADSKFWEGQVGSTDLCSQY